MTILTSYMPLGTNINAVDVFDSFNADVALVELLIWHAYCESAAVAPSPHAEDFVVF